MGLVQVNAVEIHKIFQQQMNGHWNWNTSVFIWRLLHNNNNINNNIN